MLSGNQAGAVVEMPVTEAQVNVDCGYVEYVTELPPLPALAEDAPISPKAKKQDIGKG